MSSSCLLPQTWWIGCVCRAKFITGSVAQLAAKPGGGAAWLLGLRAVPYPEAAAALCTLPGIGPKVCRLHR
jgi:endonuclease III